MTIAYADFVAAFPEFAATQTYPQAQISFWITQAYLQLDTARFGTSLDMAAMFFVAHNMVLSARDSAAASVGGIPGEAKGPMASKSVDKVSASYATGATAIDGAGEWNYTVYGQRLYRLIRARTAGPLYVPGRHRPFGSLFR